MLKIIRIAAIFAISIGIFDHCLSGINNDENITANPVKICEFGVGEVSERQIPNVNEGADLYTSPGNLAIDNNCNIYIVGQNRIMKISQDGKHIENYDLSKYGNMIALSVDRSSNYIYILQDNQILVFSEGLIFSKLIKYRAYLDENIYFRKIKVFNGNIYVYESDHDLFV